MYPLGTWTTRIFCGVACALVAISCGDKYDGPFTPGSPHYAGREWAQDTDHDGVADSIEKYQPNCRLPISRCVDNAKILSSISDKPRSLDVNDLILWEGDTAEEPILEFAPGELRLRGYTLTSSDSTKVRPRGQTLDAVRKGFAQIEAKVDGDSIAASFLVRVVSEGVAALGMSANDLNLRVGGDSLPVLSWNPPNASYTDVFLISRDTTIARIDHDRILAIRPGSARIDVTALDGGVRASFTATVLPALKAISVDSLAASDLFLVAGAAAQAPRLTWYPDSVTQRDYVIISSDPAVAEGASERGKLKPLTPGTARILVQSLDGNKSALFNVYVSATLVPLRSVEVPDMVLLAGKALQTPLATFDPPNATNRGYDLEGGDPKVAVAERGSVKPLAQGQTKFILTSLEGGLRDTFTVTVAVTDTSVHLISVKADSLSLSLGAKAAPAMTFLPTHAPDRGYALARLSGTSAQTDGDSIQGVSEGTSVFRVTTHDSGRTADFTVNVFKPLVPLQAVAAPPLLAMVLGDPDRTPAVTFTPPTATDTSFSLTSKDTTVAVIIAGNRVRARGVGKTEITTLASGKVTTVFTVTVGVKAASTDTVNTLSNLWVSGGSWDRPFSPTVTSYKVSFSSNTGSTQINASLAYSGASMAINGVPAISAVATGWLPLAPGENPYSIVITAVNGNRRAYTLTITRAKNSANADLSALTLSVGPLSPAFLNSRLVYEVMVPTDSGSTTVKPVVADSTATITVNGIPVKSGEVSPALSLTIGTTPISVVVTAAAGNTKTYSVTVTRFATALPKAVFTGFRNSFLLKADGTLWVTGDNAFGQAGTGNKVTRQSPVFAMGGMVAVASGENHSLFLKADGTLWGAGDNSYSQLGIAKDYFNYPIVQPKQVMTGVTAMAVGQVHSLFLKTDGTLWATGSNGSGELGDGTTTTRAAPVQSMMGISAISAGYFHSLVLKTDGTLWATGENSRGQLGDGSTTSRSTPTQIMNGVSAMAAGSAHSLILKIDGTLWATGENSHGQLGDGTTTNHSTPVQVLSGVSAIAAGSVHSLILKTDGTLWATGENAYGQLGDGTKVRRLAPVQIMIGVAAMAAGENHSLLLKTDGTAWATGRNDLGQLGDGTKEDRNSPVKVPY